MNPEQTNTYATKENPGRAVADTLIILGSIASLVVIVFVLVLVLVLVQAKSSQGPERGSLAALAVGSVALSWLLIHTLYTLRYARQYYSAQNIGGIEFNQEEPPRYGV